MKPKTPAQEKLQNLLNQSYALEREIAKAKEECDAEYKRIFNRTGFPPDIPETASDWELYSTMKGSAACGTRVIGLVLERDVTLCTDEEGRML